ncbi:DUF4293 family protein [Blattabacterium cuenoti]|uniref:DUF4293 family protein n=1 Tax=Blattabacterium cuenoti TaxID=1653831 RepID=UPI00163C3057|nr:DUF4293 family protein [Blattabacterium cuenoti]
MLYRIQTFYLFISILIDSFFLYFFYQKKYFFTSFSLRKIIFIFIIICLILSILSFIFFKNGKLQIFINKINILINCTHPILILLCNRSNKSIFLKKEMFFVLLCFFHICILYMANKTIKRDLKLIHSMNRIR